MEIKLNNYKKVSILGWAVYLPDNPIFREKIVNNIKASVLSGYTGISVNTALSYVKDSQITNDFDGFESIDDCKDYCNKIIEDLFNTLMKIDPSEKIQVELIRNAFARLEASFEATIFLSYEGFNYETKSIIRLIMENLNFIYQVGCVDNNKETSIGMFCKNHKISNTNFNEIKKFYPNVDLGKLYGLLSNYSHFDPKTQNTMFTWGASEAQVYLKSKQYIYENYFLLIIMLELAQDIALYLFKDDFSYSDIIVDDTLIVNTKTGLRYPKSIQLLNLIKEQLHTVKNPNNSLFDVLANNR